MDDVYVRLKPFVISFRGSTEGRETIDSSTLPQLYFVSVDVKRCFDTVKHDKLYSIISAALVEDEYMIRKFSTVITAAGKVMKKWHKRVGIPGDLPHFAALAQKLDAAGWHDAVLTDQVNCVYEQRERLLELLREHIYTNVVKVGPQFLLQSQGISQGSVLSTLLCAYFYGSLEREALPVPDATVPALLMRLVDDFLMCTTSRYAATRFLRTMYRGVDAYGCTVNTSKTKTNFQVRGHRDSKAATKLFEGSDAAPSKLSSTQCQSDDSKVGASQSLFSPETQTQSSCEEQQAPSLTSSVGLSGVPRAACSDAMVVDDTSDGDCDYDEGARDDKTSSSAPQGAIDLWMPWLGILINTQTLETRVELARYQGAYINETVTVEVAANPGQTLRDRLLFFLRSKCHPILLDGDINTLYGVALNAYQVFRLCALKFHCHVRSLPPSVQFVGCFVFKARKHLGLYRYI